MSDETPKVAVGERPPHGGRTKIHPNNAARAKANREKNKVGPLMPDDTPITLESAEGDLAQTLERWPKVAAIFLERVEAACAKVSDPEAVRAAVATNVAACDEAVAVAAAKEARADQARVEAEAAAEQATSEANALRRANGEWVDRAAELEDELRAQQEARTAASAAYEANLVILRDQAGEERNALVAAHQTAIAELQAQHETARAEQWEQYQREVNELRGQVADLERQVAHAVEDRDRAVADAAQARAEADRAHDVTETVTGRAEAAMRRRDETIEALRAEIPELVERARNEANEMANLRITAITGGAEELLAATTARLEAERDAAGTLLATEKDRTAYLIERVDDLVGEVEALRARLAGSND